ncbi:bifunctional 2-polyprenyl-6-hydroxyphenol methylase/3-demethylubiquinol 3-O-methyltransferase UbiG [Mucilaginibacter sp. UR6-11]|uniref:class I SAM-dependent methyltransferase n=1 Tax=Mucilaginibacter sp. UR6-11 TaxID=1435644 RepID=UPI001E4364D9|nr:class I SAM-dependent methyltransferase [Mucilaginibacter sp. UR6-11]MCC8427180.1 class I SAM-dependent methyltransferase [Mucilaginibacter sp. UR6-11]
MDISIQNRAIRRSKPRKPDFEELYVAVRDYEKKVYTDAELQVLPDFSIHSEEWEIRKRSSGRLLSYLGKKQRFLRILEVGCGNGWLSAKMAGLPQTYVAGLDINLAEINQANRVFKKPNLEFIYDSFTDNTFDTDKFDIVVFAASLQYFPSVVAVLQQVERILSPHGEIHVIDTPFYAPEDAARAADRCRSYYKDMGIPEMADHYFHHSVSEFWGFNYRVLFNPTSLFNRLFKKDPFYWIVIKK